MSVISGTFLARTMFTMHAVVNPTPLATPMQVLCHFLLGLVAAGPGGVRPWVRLLACLFMLGSAHGQTDAPSALQNKLRNEVGLWAQKTHQLEADQFSFAPMDARVQVQSCDRPLVMDLPFATRETVRVRCLGSPYWQLYMRLVLKPGVTLAGAPASAMQVPASTAPAAVAAVAPKAAASAAPVMRKVAVTSVKDLENGEMVRDMQAGLPLRSHDVRRAILVKQGQVVILTVGQSSGFAITARVEALQDGRMGEQIRLKNPESGRLLSGVVTGPNAARGL